MKKKSEDATEGNKIKIHIKIVYELYTFFLSQND